MARATTIKTSKALLELVERIKKGQCLLFLGAGINIGSTDPAFPYPEDHRPLQAERLARELVAGTDYKRKMPKAADTDLPKAALFLETSVSRQFLINILKEHLREGKHPSPVHQMLARLPFSIFITTNYDNLLERALSSANKVPMKLVYDPHPTKPTRNVDDDPTAQNPLVFKMHGDLDEPASIVITDEDYITFIQRMSDKDQFNPVPFAIRHRLMQWPTLFIGYSLQDYNLRLLFRTLRWRLDPATFPISYSVDLAPDHLILTVWQNRDRVISFFEYDLWRFIPWLYKQVLGKDYQP
jgi:hypothetical protein